MEFVERHIEVLYELEHGEREDDVGALIGNRPTLTGVGAVQFDALDGATVAGLVEHDGRDIEAGQLSSGASERLEEGARAAAGIEHILEGRDDKGPLRKESDGVPAKEAKVGVVAGSHAVKESPCLGSRGYHEASFFHSARRLG